MRQSSKEQACCGRKIKIAAVNPSQQAGRIHEWVARSAYRIFEGRHGIPGDQLEDWRRAESEVVGPLSCGFLTLDDKISVSTDAGLFDEGLIEVCAEPDRLTICGRARTKKEKVEPEQSGGSKREFVFRVLDLPVEIDPSNVTARFRGRILQIDLPRASRKFAPRTNAA